MEGDRGLVALTGGSGFVGSHAAEALLAAGYRVRALVRRPHQPGWLSGLDVEPVPGDVREAESLARLVDGAVAVVHVAGKTSARSEAEYLEANAVGTGHLARATARLATGAHFLLISSQAAGGPSVEGRAVCSGDTCRPVSAYGRSKLAGEKELAAVPGLGFTVLRPSSVYGPRERAIKDLFSASARGMVPLLAGGKPRVQFVYALDLARAIVAAIAREPRGEVFFAAHPEVLDYRQIARTLAELRRPPARLLPVPAGLVRAAGTLAGLSSRFSSAPPVFNSEKAEEMLQDAWLCDVQPAQAALGQPFTTPFAEGARLTWEWYRAQGWL